MGKHTVNVMALVTALGGPGNVVSARACVTRLRTVVHDPAAINEARLKKAGACGVVTTGDDIQIIVGAIAHEAADTITALITDQTAAGPSTTGAVETAPLASNDTMTEEISSPADAPGPLTDQPAH